MRERERKSVCERERERQSEGERECERECVCERGREGGRGTRYFWMVVVMIDSGGNGGSN